MTGSSPNPGSRSGYPSDSPIPASTVAASKSTRTPPPDASRFRAVRALFDQVHELPPEQWDRALTDQCDDPDIRAEVVRLLRRQQADQGDAFYSRVSKHVDDVMSRAVMPDVVGQVVGPYQVARVLGQGGMGVVYLGWDERLERKAALKAVLPHEARDLNRIERLRREARVLASVSHPNLATVYGLEEAHGRLFVAMEFIEGKTLSQKLGRSAMTVAETLRVMEQVAAGLEAAHDAGVIHRDLKPGNIMFQSDGTAKVLDFGLAREMRGADASDEDEPQRPALTRHGSCFGTPAYMSPEQARGEHVDRQSDIFSFGSVLFRCLSGKPAFDGETNAELIDAVMNREPDWSRLPPTTPEAVKEILRRCLAKLAADRYRDIGDVRLDIRSALQKKSWDYKVAVHPKTSRWKRASPWLAIAASIAVLCLGLLLMLPKQTGVSVRAGRFDLLLPEGAAQGDLERIQVAVSPDGKTVVVACSTALDGRALWMRSTNASQWRRIDQTHDAHRPFFSADGQWVGFHRGSFVYKRRLSDGGDPIRIGPSSNWYGGAFTEDGGTVLASHWYSPLSFVAPQAREAHDITRVDPLKGDVSHLSPVRVTGTSWVLYNVWHGGEECDVAAVDLKTGATHTLITNGNTPKVASTPRGDYVLFERGSTIFAAPFDRKSASVTGPQTAIVEGVMVDGTRFAAYFDVADDGTLVFFPGGLFTEESRLAYVNPDGTSTPVNSDRTSFAEPSFSADAGMLLTSVKGKIYRTLVYNLNRGTKQFLQVSGDAPGGAISPDGRTAAVTAMEKGVYAIYLFDLATSRRIRQIAAPGVDYASDICFSPDGQFITYTQASSREGTRDIWRVDLAEGSVPQRVVATPMAEMHGQISPDAKWIAFASESSGRREVFVAGLPSGQPVRQITFTGGETPVWARDGKSIFYTDPQLRLVEIDIDADGTAFGKTRIAYDRPFGQSDSIARSVTVAPDGRPVVVEPSERRRTVSALNVITHWWKLLPG